jgi:GTP pyrophosphokinase
MADNPTSAKLIQATEGLKDSKLIQLIQEAFQFSEKKHEGQFRRSGEPFFVHPFRVALIVAEEMKLDPLSVAAALLHDLVEDTKVTLSEIEAKFGVETAQIVDGLTKLAHIHFRSNQEKQAENFRKMLLAMSKDIRVVLIKLADRLDNMRTLDSLSETKRLRIAKETMEIYAPLANRLGMSKIKLELEDSAFAFLNPEASQKLKKEIAARHTVHQKFIEEVRRELLRVCYENNLVIEVQGRVKNLYSVYRKMSKQNLHLDQIYDVVAFRIICKSVLECYEVLGVIHAQWRPIPGRFKDYIAMPKPNLYQSLHTVVIGPRGQLVEIQIRTDQMHQVAEYGVAAHWKYKELSPKQHEATYFDWVNRLLTQRTETKNPHEFISNVKTDLFQSDIYVFTPNGDVLEFPEGATPLDFAYAIHTDLGHKTTGAIVNGAVVPLRSHLKSGDIVEIISSDKSRPSKDWLKFVKSSKARHKIRSYLRAQERKTSAKIGEQLLESALRKRGASLQRELEKPRFKEVLSKFSCTDATELFIEIGYGKHLVTEVAAFVLQGQPEPLQGVPEEQPSFLQKLFERAKSRVATKDIIEVTGLNEVLIRLAKCCSPVPGDDIIGFVTRGRGVTVHSTDCPKVPDFDEKRVIEVRWKRGDTQLHRAIIRVISEDVPGILSKMSKVITDAGVNISRAQVTTTKSSRAINVFHVQVRDLSELNKILRQMEKLDGIYSVSRERKKPSEP